MSYKKITICEMLRQINDLSQDNPEVRVILKTAYKSAKKMNDRLNYYSNKYEGKKKCNFKWEDNPRKKEVMKLRGAKGYKKL